MSFNLFGVFEGAIIWKLVVGSGCLTTSAWAEQIWGLCDSSWVARAGRQTEQKQVSVVTVTSHHISKDQLEFGGFGLFLRTYWGVGPFLIHSQWEFGMFSWLEAASREHVQALTQGRRVSIRWVNRVPKTWVKKKTGFGLFFLLPIGFFEYPFVTNSHLTIGLEKKHLLATVIPFRHLCQDQMKRFWILQTWGYDLCVSTPVEAACGGVQEKNRGVKNVFRECVISTSD